MEPEGSPTPESSVSLELLLSKCGRDLTGGRNDAILRAVRFAFPLVAFDPGQGTRLRVQARSPASYMSQLLVFKGVGVLMLIIPKIAFVSSGFHAVAHLLLVK